MVRVRVLADDRRIVLVVVMSVVVAMGVVVIDGRVDMPVAVALGEVQHEPPKKR